MAPQRGADERLAADLKGSPKIRFRLLKSIEELSIDRVRLVKVVSERGEKLKSFSLNQFWETIFLRK